jgi:hypothetical protein
MRYSSKWLGLFVAVCAGAVFASAAVAQQTNLSDEAESCITCHTKQ